MVLTAIERATIAGYVDTMESYGYELAVIDGTREAARSARRGRA